MAFHNYYSALMDGGTRKIVPVNYFFAPYGVHWYSFMKNTQSGQITQGRGTIMPQCGNRDHPHF